MNNTNTSEQANSNPEEKVTVLIIDVPGKVEAVLNKEDWDIEVVAEFGQKWLHFTHKNDAEQELIIPATGLVFQRRLLRSEYRKVVRSRNEEKLQNSGSSIASIIDEALGTKRVIKEAYTQYKADKAAGMPEEEAMKKVMAFVKQKVRERTDQMADEIMKSVNTAETEK